ncbi:hypothetical protein [Nocardia sp. NPDC051750]|uniref:hypothetical protein n=1 Tax=Nocardia sp. NPDC051750 TaxID=3364325 RepID=UPI0037BDE5C7
MIENENHHDDIPEDEFLRQGKLTALLSAALADDPMGSALHLIQSNAVGVTVEGATATVWLGGEKFATASATWLNDVTDLRHPVPEGHEKPQQPEVGGHYL